MNSHLSARIPFKPMLLASALSLLLAACGGGGGAGFSFFPPAGSTPPAVQPPATQPEAQPEASLFVSQARFTPNAGTTEGSSDASTALALPGDFMLVADDESNVLRVYPRAGGAAVKEWSYELEGPKLTKELDLEAGTRIGDTLYFTGSNSNKKDGADAAADRSHLFAVKVSGTGADTAFSYVGQFALLEAQLIAWDKTNAHGLGADHFGFAVSAGAGIVPERIDGFSIEGMTSSPGDTALWLGFRAPQTGNTVRAKALIVPVQNYAALIAGTATQATFGAPIELELGGRGIRSIDKGTDGNYLIVAGPAGAASPDVDRNFALFAWDGNPNSAPVELSNDLDKLREKTGGSFESTVEVAGPVKAGTQVQLLLDNGDTLWDGKTASKDLPPADQKFDGFVVRLGSPLIDTTAPKMKKASLAGLVGVNLDASITLSFNEAVRLGSGSIVLHKADGSVVETFHANSPSTRLQVAFNKLKLVPTAPLAASSGYYVTIDGNAITDPAGNAFAGISDATTLSFTSTAGATTLATGDLLFMAANAEAPDAYAFVLLKAVNGGTKVLFTDRDRKSGANEFTGITNETAFFWTADRNLPAGTIVTIQTDVTGNPIADKGFTLGSPGGIGKSETIYAIAGGTIAGLGDGVAGQITAVGDYLATITLGGAAGTIPDAVTTAGTAFSFTVTPANQTNAIYTGSLDRSDMAAFAARVKNQANWTVRYAPEVGYPLTNDSLFGDRLP
jgi:hypothetical protein